VEIIYIFTKVIKVEIFLINDVLSMISFICRLGLAQSSNCTQTNTCS